MYRTIGKTCSALTLVALIGACGQKQETPTAPQPSGQTEARPLKEQGIPQSSTEQEKAWEPYRAEGRPERVGGDRAPRGMRFAQEISMPHPLKTIVVSHMVSLPVVVRNSSRETWKAATNPEETQPVNLSYHWIEGPTVRESRVNSEMSFPDDSSSRRLRPARTFMLEKQGKVVVMDGRRTALPHDVPPGETVTLNAQIQAPDRAGDFTLRISMVKENVAWFENRGAQPLDIPVKVTAR